jgi:uncharacterized protein YecE (DUF72 family)
MYSDYILRNSLSNCLVGTSGWHYKDWETMFYPERTLKRVDKLRYYSQFFDCIEIDSVFYNLYTPKLAKNWMEKVKDNKNFMFSLKLDNAFTHRDNFSSAGLKLLLSFVDEFSSNGKLESVLLQFSHHFLNTKENRSKILKLSKIFKDNRVVVELSDKSWHSPLTYNFLEESKLHLCIIDQPHVLNNIGYSNFVLGRYVYFRLCGRNSETWVQNDREERFDYLYSNFEISEIFRKVIELRKRSDKVVIILNNYPMGKAIVNAFSFLSFIKNRPVLIPKETVSCYSHLKPIAYKVNTSQLPIFSI